VNAKANVPLTLPVKGKLGTVRPAGKVDTSVKGKGSAGTSGVDARFAGNGSANAGTGRLGTRVGLEQDGRIEAGARHHGLSGKATARVRGNARGDARIRHGRVSGKARGHLKQSAKARSHGLAKPRFDVPSERHSKGGLPLRGVGREVGNAVQLSLAGWLIALTAGACFGASRFVRRLQRLGS
jgi:hypothetical protein